MYSQFQVRAYTHGYYFNMLRATLHNNLQTDLKLTVQSQLRAKLTTYYFVHQVAIRCRFFIATFIPMCIKNLDLNTSCYLNYTTQPHLQASLLVAHSDVPQQINNNKLN